MQELPYLTSLHKVLNFAIFSISNYNTAKPNITGVSGVHITDGNSIQIAQIAHQNMTSFFCLTIMIWKLHLPFYILYAIERKLISKSAKYVDVDQNKY